jgi:uncharacterized membrane protein YcaP (DUF421 family)
MKKEDIHFGDWHRWIFGTTPPAFTWEVAIRAALIFTIMLVLVRWLGRRMKGQISASELAVVLTLGAIIAAPMQKATAGLLPSIVVLLAVLGMHRLMNWLAFKHRKVEIIEQGKMGLLLRDGCLDLKQMHQYALSQEELFSLLRNESVSQLGELRRVYMEANGRVSLYKLAEPQPGLSVSPSEDYPPAAVDGPAHDRKVCATCGHVPSPTEHAGTRCSNCGYENWVPAAL